MLAVVIAAAFPATDALAQGFEPVAVLTGIARVKDGDGLLFGEVEIRLRGIAAPELGDPLGNESAENLRAIAGGRQVVCYLDGTRAGKSRRPVATCTVGGRDLGRQQVLDGMALDCARYSGGAYSQAERSAYAAGKRIRQIYPRPGYCR